MNNKEKALRDVGYKKKVKQEIVEAKEEETSIIKSDSPNATNSQFMGRYD